MSVMGCRLIPAHAGKTSGAPLRRSADDTSAFGAHPRSRGENDAEPEVGSDRPGSSPLTRGKHYQIQRITVNTRLIPAHAGKTWAIPDVYTLSAAHPRSRGENITMRPAGTRRTGSSPLTRGKRWAPGAQVLADAAHPRSRGENLPGQLSCGSTAGSSPLTRGKRLDRAEHRTNPGLIPAHAGKTFQRRSSRAQSAAHPRSRGENPSTYRRRSLP